MKIASIALAALAAAIALPCECAQGRAAPDVVSSAVPPPRAVPASRVQGGDVAEPPVPDPAATGSGTPRATLLARVCLDRDGYWVLTKDDIHDPGYVSAQTLAASACSLHLE
jgi:hypothetical protein